MRTEGAESDVRSSVCGNEFDPFVTILARWIVNFWKILSWHRRANVQLVCAKFTNQFKKKMVLENGLWMKWLKSTVPVLKIPLPVSKLAFCTLSIFEKLWAESQPFERPFCFSKRDCRSNLVPKHEEASPWRQKFDYQRSNEWTQSVSLRFHGKLLVKKCHFSQLLPR